MKNDDVDDFFKKINEEEITKDDLKEAQNELYEPNSETKGNKIIKIILIVLLSLILIGLVFLYFYNPFKNETIKRNTKDNIIVDHILSKNIPLNGEYTIELNLENQKIDESKIEWKSEDNKIVSLSSCKNNKCTVDGKTIGETFITATYNKNIIAWTKIAVKENTILYVYQGDDHKYMTSYYNDDADNIDYKYTCEALDCNVIGANTKNYAVIFDKEYYEFNLTTHKKTKLYYELHDGNYYRFIESDNKIIGYISNKGYYSASLNKYLVEEKSSASDDVTITEDHKYIILISYNEKTDKTISKFYDINTGAYIRTFNNSVYDIQEIEINNKKYLKVCSGNEDDVFFGIYDTNYKLLLDNIEDLYAKDNRIFVTNYGDSKIYREYDNDFNLVKTYGGFKDVKLADANYLLGVDYEDNLSVYTTDKELVTTFLKLTKDYDYHRMLSGYYTEKGKNGIYAVVTDYTLGVDLSEEDDQGYEFYYIPETKETGKISTTIGGYAKPILYLYPKVDNTKIKVTFNHPEYLSTTYPKYNKSWNVTAKKDGSLYDKNGNYYYALYWDENKYQPQNFSEGFYVTKDNASKFLEDKLTLLGLNLKERNEFIMYWLPVLEKNKQNLVYFEQTEEREAFNRINISPNPDSLLRIAIHIKKVDKKIDIKEQKLKTFKRTGFTAVEWGGINY